MLRAQTIDPETTKLLSAGMQNFVCALGQVQGLADEGPSDEIH